MKMEKFKKLTEADNKISAFCSEGSDLFTDLEIFAGKDRMECFPKKKREYKKEIKKIRRVLEKIEKLADAE